jgi:hypothetical protein
MMLTLSVIAASTLVIAAAFVAIARAYDVAEPVLASEATAVGLADPAADTLNGHQQRNNEGSVMARTEWQLTTVTALHDAEEMLDYLEMQGYAERELMVLGNSCFAVRWR